VADHRYLKKRREGWYLQVAVPAAARWKFGKLIIRSLHTKDKAVAQARRWTAGIDEKGRPWPSVAGVKDDIRKAEGQISLTAAEINQDAMAVYAEALETFRRSDLGEVIPMQQQWPEGLGKDDMLSPEVTKAVKAIELRRGIALAPASETYWTVTHAILKARQSAARARVAEAMAACGAPPEAEPFEPPANFVEAPTPVMKPARPKVGKGKTFDEASDEYLAARKDKITKGVLTQSKTTFRLFGEFIGAGVALADITTEKASEFLATIERLPPGWRQQREAAELSLGELVNKYGNGDKHLAPATVNRNRNALSAFFVWLKRERRHYYNGPNPFEGLSRELGKIVGHQDWKIEELNTLFAALAGEGSKGDVRWASLIAAFSGMRSEEIAGLGTEDIRQERGVWYFDLHEGRQLKTDAAARKVPLHSLLIDAGLLTYRDDLTAGRLFPSFKPGSLSVTFRKYRRKIGLTRAKVDFHGLRAGVATILRNARVPELEINALMGWTDKTMLAVYGRGGLPLSTLQEVVEKIEYPGLTLDHLDVRAGA
jgi:integrase